MESGGRKKWLLASVIAFNSITGEHKLEYDMDGDIEDLDLLVAERDWMLEH